MKRDYRMSLSSEIDMRHYSFVRDTKLPHGTFEQPWNGDRWVLIVSLAIIAGIIIGGLYGFWEGYR